MPEGTYSVDFFPELNPIDHQNIENYLQSFFMALQQVQKELSSVAKLREVPPFYFTRCSGCQMYILTNRDLNSSIPCHNCNKNSNTQPIQNNLMLKAALMKIWAHLNNPVSKDTTAWLHLL